jgi:hypothetical protein
MALCEKMFLLVVILINLKKRKERYTRAVVEVGSLDLRRGRSQSKLVSLNSYGVVSLAIS